MKEKIKSRRGFKICPKCYSEQGVRTKACKICSNQFPPSSPKVNFKRKRVKTEKVNWRDLQKGDNIRVMRGGGSSYEGYDINRKGIYIVHRLDSKGILAWSKKGYGLTYIYMGNSHVNKYGFTCKPHTIRRVIK